MTAHGTQRGTRDTDGTDPLREHRELQLGLSGNWDLQGKLIVPCAPGKSSNPGIVQRAEPGELRVHPLGSILRIHPLESIPQGPFLGIHPWDLSLGQNLQEYPGLPLWE